MRLRALLPAFAAVGVFVSVPLSASAQDHLECYRIKDPHKFVATADLTPAETPPFPVATGCDIRVTGRKYCVPVTKALTSSTAPEVEFPTTAVTSNFVCYKVKCPKVTISDTEISDQFGTRTVSRFKTSEICAPAVVGQPPPFTCGDQSPLMCGPGSCPSGTTCQLDTGTLACGCLPPP